jgi:hypothetical protein
MQGLQLYYLIFLYGYLRHSPSGPQAQSPRRSSQDDLGCKRELRSHFSYICTETFAPFAIFCSVYASPMTSRRRCPILSCWTIEGEVIRLPEDNFDRLLNAMPRVADSVNAFTSTEVQQLAFMALMKAAGIGDNSALQNLINGSAATSPEFAEIIEAQVSPAIGALPAAPAEPKATPRTRGKKSTKAAKVSISAAKDINFRPEGKPSLREVVEEKSPSTQDDKNLVAVHYLQMILELKDIGLPQVLAAYREASWRPPANPDNSLQVTASKRGTLDTKNMKDIRVTLTGETAFDHDLPRQKK